MVHRVVRGRDVMMFGFSPRFGFRIGVSGVHLTTGWWDGIQSAIYGMMERRATASVLMHLHLLWHRRRRNHNVAERPALGLYGKSLTRVTYVLALETMRGPPPEVV